MAQSFEAFYPVRPLDGLDPTDDPLVLSVDGKGIVMRKGALRAAPEKAAERKARKLKTRLSRGENANRKRMATVATVFSIAAQARTAEAVMGLKEDTAPRPRARDKRVWTSVEQPPADVIEQVFQEALDRDPEQRLPWGILVDGQDHQQKTIRAGLRQRPIQATLVLAFIHVVEYLWAPLRICCACAWRRPAVLGMLMYRLYIPLPALRRSPPATRSLRFLEVPLWNAAYGFHADGSEAAEARVAERALKILQGKASGVAAGMRRRASLRELTPAQRKPVDTCANYLLKYGSMLIYDEYLAKGLPIATGVIEGACRHLVKDRMDITGARWGLQRAEAILKLRSLQASNDFDAYWNFYTAQSLKKNHASNYAGPKEAA